MQPAPKTKPARNRPSAKNNPPGARAPRPSLAWVLALVIIPLLLVAPALVPGKRLLPQLPVASAPLDAERPGLARQALEGSNFSTSDRLFPVLTDQVEARRQILTGTLPTWEPRLGAGVPLFAGSIAALAYPPNWLSLVLAPDLAAAPLAMLSLFLAGLGMALFLRRLGLGPGAVLIGAFAVQASTWAATNLHYFMKVDAALWLPWMLWSIEGMAQGKRRSGPWLGLSVGMSLLAGFPPIAIFGIFTSGLYALTRFLSPALRANAPKLLAQCAGFVVLGFGIGAWQLLPTAEASAGSLRQERETSDIVAQALPFESSLGLLAPDLFGMPDETVFGGHLPIVWLVTAAEHAEQALVANALEWNLHLGSLALLLGFIALLTRPKRAVFPFLALLLWLGFSQAWPGVRLLYHVPGLAIGAPVRSLAVGWILLPWLAALGVSAILSDLGRGEGRAPWAALLVGGSVFCLALIGWFWVDPSAFPRQLTELLMERHGKSAAEVAGVLSTEDMFQAAVRLRKLLSGLCATGALLAGATLLVSITRGQWGRGRLGLAFQPALGAALGLGIATAPRLAGGAFDLPSSGAFLALLLGALALLFIMGRPETELTPAKPRPKRADQRAGQRSRRAATTLAIPLLVGLMAEAIDVGPNHLRPQDLGGQQLFPKSAAIDAIQSSLAMDSRQPGNIPGAAEGRVLRLDLSEAGVAEVIRLARPNLLAGYELGDMSPYTIFTPRTLTELIRANDPAAGYLSGNSRISDVGLLDTTVLDLFRVNTILSVHDLAGRGDLVEVLPRSTGDPVPGAMRIYHRPDSMPIARLLPNARIAPDDATALAWLLDPSFDPRTETILAPGTALPAGSSLVNLKEGDDADPWTSASVTPRRSSASRLDLEVNSTRGGWLVMSEQFAPNWKVNINGQDSTTIRTDHAFRALWIPPGAQLVRTWYEPWSLRIGFLSLLASCSLLAWLIFFKKL
jgi:hypothetical protein